MSLNSMPDPALPDPALPDPAPPDPARDTAPALREGRYRLIEVMGEGGMATVYRGIDTRLRVARAIKILLPQLAARPKLRGRFEDEARTMARLTHPHIVAVQDVDVEGDRVFLVMDLLEGGTLWEWVHRHGPMPARLAVDATLPVLDALGFAHRAGVVHRDVKPQNVLLTRDGVPRLTDFGIARIDAEGSGTRTAAVMGTWTYMPPEQRRSAKEVDLRADLYAVGAMIFALVRGEDPPDLFAADLDASLLEGIPEPLAEVIRAATRYQRDDRYRDAAAMGQALLACRSQLPEVPASLQALAPATMGSGLSLTGQLHSMKDAASSSPPSSSPPSSSPPSPSLPPVSFLPPLEAPARQSAAATMVPPIEETFAQELLDETEAAPRRSSRAPLLALGGLLAAGALASVTYWAWPSPKAVAEPVATEFPAVAAPVEPAAQPEPELASVAPAEVPQTPVPQTPVPPTPVPARAPVQAAAAPSPSKAPAEPPSLATAQPATAQPATAQPAPEPAPERIAEASPAVAEAPPPAPAPAPASSPASAGPPGRVSVLGPISKATLIHKSSGSRVSPGEVPVGEYWLEVRFNGSSEDLRLGSVRVISGFALTFTCNSRNKTCH